VGLAIAIDVRHFVHQAIVFGFLDDGVAFFFGDSPAAWPCLNEVTGAFVELNAHILFKVAASFVHKTAGNTARARGDRDIGGGARHSVRSLRLLWAGLSLTAIQSGRLS
jgi:hypothetical protein